MRWIRDYQPQPQRSKLYQRALSITVAGNILLAISKGVAAYLTGSAALFADAANSASDVLYSLLMVLGLWVSQRPPDLSHPQGHSRFEPLVGLTVSASMAFAGYEAARFGIERFFSGGMAVEPGLPTIVLVGSSAVKAVMFMAIRGIALKVDSPALRVTARDNLSDVLTSAAALVGVYGSDIVSPLLDPIAGILVAFWIFRNVFFAVTENLGFLTGAGAPVELRLEIVRIAESVPGVTEVHHTMAEYVGPKLVVDMHINVDGEMTLNQAHAIADKVAEEVSKLPSIDRVYVHVEPNGTY